VIASTDAPRQVVRATILLWVSILLSVIETTYLLAIPEPDLEELWSLLIAVSLAVLVVNCLFIHFASRRRNWARFALLACLVVTVLAMVFFPSQASDPRWLQVVEVLAAVLQAIGVFWLFTGEGARWYRADR
jgi:uncharacterized membrane protein